ncbi:hypothetical protein [Tsukamurella soli]|uniref:Uncharacterized protein n=1 Tax=Tsukamurella soli TaxID=644556 RepID=A0ABP8JAD2_9ACTN
MQPDSRSPTEDVWWPDGANRTDRGTPSRTWSQRSSRAEAGAPFEREPVESAAWFHDAVYHIGRSGNEERSVQLA